MSRNLIARRAGVLAATATVGVLATAGPASADVKVEPPSAVQGSGQNVRFTVTNTGDRPITRVTVTMPADTPIAEVFPLSVPDWAPQITPLKLTTPLTSIHAGAPVTETASAVTWIAVGGDLAPGESADLAVALGPLPATSAMTFTLTSTYADGRPGPAEPPAVLQLTPGTGAQGGGHGTTHGGTAGGTSDADAAAFAALAEQADDGPGFWSVAGWIVAALAAVAAGAMVVRNRHRAEPTEDDDEPSKDEPEPVGAGTARVTPWSYRDGPG